MNEIEILDAKLADLEALSGLWSRFLSEQGDFDPKLAPSPDAVERFRADLPEWIHDTTRIVAVAKRSGAAVGFAAAYLWSLPPIFVAGPELFIEYFYVDESSRRLGVGTALFDELRQRAEQFGARRIRLAVADGNEVGTRFWAAVGGQTVVREIVIPVDAAEKPQRPPLGFSGNP